jgi:uncharacterized protein YaiI (UPF0178 family)
VPTIYVDADACPVKDDIFRIAKRYDLKVIVVANAFMNLPRFDWIESIVVGSEFDAVDDWIAGKCSEGDIVVTNDLLLAARCLEKQSRVIDPRGHVVDSDNIGEKLAMRELNLELRQRGAMNLGPTKMLKNHRSNFLAAFDELINRVRRGK